VLMFKILVIQATNNLSDERAEFLINDRLSFMRFLGLGLEDRVPDARTIWLFREKLTTAGAIKRLFEQFDAMLRQAGYIAMSGQIVDASLVAAPRQRNTDDEKQAIKQGRIPANWKAKPAKLRHKDRDARWTVKLMTEGPFERFTARGSFAFCRPFLLIARRDEARLIAVFVNIPIAHDHLYLRSHRLVGGSRPTCVSSLPKPHLFLQLRQSDCVVVHGIPSPSPSDTETVGCNDGRILSFVGLKEGGGPLSPHSGFRVRCYSVEGFERDAALALCSYSTSIV